MSLLAENLDTGLWEAFSEPNRLVLLDHLITSGEQSASALARISPISRQAVAKHMAVLEAANLVTQERKGREVRYSAIPARVEEAARTMAELASNWDSRLAKIKEISEAIHATRIKESAQ